MLVCLLAAFAALAPDGSATQADDRLILTPSDRDVIFEIEGVPPRGRDQVCSPPLRVSLFAKYRGSLEIVPQSDGRLRIINALSFDDYLAGLAEVPLSWPAAALRAQVIAARSYAMDAYLRGRSDAGERGYHICSTDQCQVYRGAAVELGAFGERWTAAIARTRGKVLRYGGRVIQSFYFSTSDGRTRSSFPGGTPQPWLPSVEGNDDRAPLGRWTAPVRLSDLATILSTCDAWDGGRITQIRDLGEDVRISGQGATMVVSKRDLRIDLNNEARRAFPERYPNPTGSQTRSRLPQTIPSSSYSVQQRGARAIFRGRGWGHFVGMSQWGAYYMALDGASTREILKHYYGAARIGSIDEPEAIRVLAAEDLRQVRIRVRGEATVTTGTGSELAPGARFTVSAGTPMRIVRGKGPRERGILEVTTTGPTATGHDPATPIGLPFEASRPVRVWVHVFDADGTEVFTTPERSFESGARQVTIPANSLAPGTYEVVLEAYDGIDRVRTAPIALSIAEAAAPPGPGEDPGSANRTIPIAAGIGVLLLATGAIAARFIRR